MRNKPQGTRNQSIASSLNCNDLSRVPQLFSPFLPIIEMKICARAKAIFHLEMVRSMDGCVCLRIFSNILNLWAAS